MKSDLFKQGHSFDDDEKIGINTLCGLSNDEFINYLSWYSERIKENSPRRPKDILALTRESKYSAKEIIDALDVCFDLIYLCFEDKDKIEDVTDDLIEIEIINKDCKEVFIQRLKNAYDSFESEIKADYEQEMVTRHFNRLIGHSIRCEIIPKFEPEFKHSKLKVEDYQTKIENLYPAIRLDFGYENYSNEPKHVTFYLVNENSIDKIIDSLLAAKIQLNEIKKIKSKIFTNKQ